LILGGRVIFHAGKETTKMSRDGGQSACTERRSVFVEGAGDQIKALGGKREDMDKNCSLLQSV